MFFFFFFFQKTFIQTVFNEMTFLTFYFSMTQVYNVIKYGQ